MAYCLEHMSYAFDFFQRLFSALLSTFDVVTDTVNSFNLLGYGVNEYIAKKVAKLCTTDTLSNTCGNNTYFGNMTDSVLHQNTSIHRDHPVWGYTSFAIMSAPGIMATIFWICVASEKYYKEKVKGCMIGILVSMLTLMFPVSFTFF